MSNSDINSNKRTTSNIQSDNYAVVALTVAVVAAERFGIEYSNPVCFKVNGQCSAWLGGGEVLYRSVMSQPTSRSN